MEQRRHTLLGLSTTDIAVFLFGFLVFTLSLGYHFHIDPVNSDNVSQKILIHQSSLAHHTIWLPADNFILKLPINLVTDLLIKDPVKNIFFSTWLMDLIGFFLFFVVAVYFFRKYTEYFKLPLIFYAAFLFLCAGRDEFLQSLASPQNRNLEIGIAFAFLWFIDAYIKKLRIRRLVKKEKLRISLGAIFFGLFLYSDPAFVFFLVVPLVLTIFIHSLYQRDFAKYAGLFIFLIGSLGCLVVFKQIFLAMDVHIYTIPAKFVTLDKLDANIVNTVKGMLALWRADIFSVALKPSALIILLNFIGLILAMIILPFRLLKKKRFWLTFIGLQPLYLIGVYLLSNNVVNVDTIRYEILLPFYGVIIISLGMINIPKLGQRIVTYVLIGAFLGNFAITVKDYVKTRGYRPNSYNQEIAALLLSNNLRKGYAPYWNASSNAFFSSYRTVIFPVTCGDQRGVSPFYILDDSDTLKLKTEKSFIIVANYPSVVLTNLYGVEYESEGKDCTTQAAQKQFGEPEYILNATNYTEIYVYSYDILKNMQPRTNFTSPY